LDEIVEAAGGRVIGNSGAEDFSGVSTDSRTIAGGELFIPLRGPNFDGHDFLGPALDRAAGALVDKEPAGVFTGKTIVLVQDTLRALQKVAAWKRKKDAPIVVGVTGTNGKTTTKEMTAAVLSARFGVLKTEGNLNNQIGLPLTLCKLDGHGAAVLEMGASRRGDIHELCEIASPDLGVLTNVGAAHLEFFGDVASVRNTKLELMDFAPRIAANADDRYMMEGINRKMSGGACACQGVLTYGVKEDADIKAFNVQAGKGSLKAVVAFPDGRNRRVELSVGGSFNVYNALAALAVGWAAGVDPDEAVEVLNGFKGVPMRFEVKEKDGVTFIVDAYNANPASVREALTELVRFRRGRVIAALGDMLELGIGSEDEHRELGRWMAEFCAVDVFVAVGPGMKAASEVFKAESTGSSIFNASDSLEAASILKGVVRPGDTVLVKGSRGLKMERSVD
jgi:UDP-N-acetylmuramoyl-tripeptide--D-alanyl-D-alanine ligase